jgi:hypothetical protein
MGRVLLITLFLTAGAPALAFDLSDFLSGLVGTRSVAEQPEKKVAKPVVRPAVAPQDHRKPRNDEATLSPRAVWMIGVFR